MLGIEPLDIHVVTGDTDLTPVDLGSYSSRVTLMMGNAAIQAAERARDLIAGAVAEKMGVPEERLAFAAGRVFDVERPDDPTAGLPFAEAAVLAEAKFGTIGTVGSYTPPPSPGRFSGAGVGPSPAYSYSAAVVEVAVVGRDRDRRRAEDLDRPRPRPDAFTEPSRSARSRAGCTWASARR